LKHIRRADDITPALVAPSRGRELKQASASGKPSRLSRPLTGARVETIANLCGWLMPLVAPSRGRELKLIIEL